MSDSLRQEVLAGTESGARGSFTLAKEKAREKLRSFALVNPIFYILQIMQALVASGARRVQITHGPYEVPDPANPATSLTWHGIKLEFDGPGYTPYEVENIYDYLFESQQEEANDRLRCLALGLISCEELAPRRLELRCGEALWRWRGGQETFTLVPPTAADELSTTPAHHYVAIAYAQEGDGGSEMDLVRESCTTIPIYLSINQYPVSSPAPARYGGLCPRPAMPFREEVKQADGGTRPLEGVIGLPYVGLGRTKLHILRYGVLINIKMEADLQPSVLAAIEHRPLRQNASQTGVVEDDVYRDCVNRTQQRILDFARSLCGSPTSVQPEPVRGFLLAVMEQWLTREIVMGAPEDAPAELRGLLAMPLFTDLAGVRRSLQSIAAQYRHDGFVSTVGRRYPYLAVGQWLVLNPTPEERSTLSALFEEVRDVESNLHAIVSSMRRDRHVLAPSGTPLAVAPPIHGCELDAGMVGKCGLRIFIEDVYPGGLCRLLGRDGLQSTGISVKLNGWSLTADLGNVSGLRDWSELSRLTQLSLLRYGPQLYAKLHEAVHAGRGLRSVGHAREHLLVWWNFLLSEALRQAGPQADTAAVRRVARQALGEESWNQPFFETRNGGWVSLADVETWLQHADRMWIAVGGSHLQHRDNAIDASPAASAFLARLFGAEHFEQATLRMILPADEKLQDRLAGASGRSSAEWEELQRDREQAAAEVVARAAEEARAREEAARLASEWKEVRQEARARQSGPSTADKVLEGTVVPTPAPATLAPATPAPATQATPAPATQATPAPATQATPAPATQATPAPATQATPAPATQATPAPATLAPATPAPAECSLVDVAQTLIVGRPQVNTAGEPQAARRPDVAGEPQAARRPDVAGEPQAARRPDVAGEPQAARRPDVAGEPQAARRPDVAGGPEAGAAATEPPPRQTDRDMPFAAPTMPPPATPIAEHAFNEKTLSGFLALTLEDDPLVAVSVRGSRLGLFKLFSLPISGWVESAERLPATVTSALAAIDWTREQADILEGHVRMLYDRLSTRMNELDPDSPAFARGRQHLISYLRRFLTQTRERLREARPDDELLRLRFLPVGGGSMASLLTLAQQTREHGYLRVLPEGGRLLAEDEPAAMVGPTVPENFYKMLFATVTRPPDWNPSEPTDVRLLAALRRELRLLRHDGDFRLSDEVLGAIQYKKGLRCLLRHDPFTHETFLDPTHPTLRQLTTHFERDRSVLPLLACAVYGAISRALEEVATQHEIAFMTALLESSPKEPPRA